MKVEKKLAQKKEAVERELELILAQEDSILFQAMRYTIFSGGKRYRPLLLLSSGECFNVSERELLPFACALELIHNYSLIHDDLPSMDNDDFRRGKPSSHRAFGENIALLAGDSLLTLAFEVMTRASHRDDLLLEKYQVIREISQFAGVGGMIGGQVIDIMLPPEKITEDSMHELIQKKTGSLIVASVKTGAILGKASRSQTAAIVEYGKSIGFAFQIRDDIIDATNEVNNAGSVRPNYVSLFGLQESKLRLRKFVEIGLEILDKACLESDELRHLALMLLDFDYGK
ncbi:MAG: polyprenyl synthetase family protein [Candidatus Aminicenantaceae bacterium]